MKFSFLVSILLFSTHLFAQHTMVNGSYSACSGSFFDPGGTGNYSSSQTITETYCSNSANAIKIVFGTFDLETNYDYLYVYDGPTDASTLVGTFTGTTTPSDLTSSTGCLTLKFTSDGSVTKAGWVATISCVAFPTCSDGIQNGSETGIDCGGSCTACIAAEGYSCTTAKVITNGYTTASTITSPGNGGAEDWVTSSTVSTGSAASNDFTDPDVYLFEYTTGSDPDESFYFTIQYDLATDENHSIAVWSGCTGTSLTGNIASATQITKDIAGVCAAGLSANTTYYISVGNADATKKYLTFDVIEFVVESVNAKPSDECATASLMNMSLPLYGSTRCSYTASAGSPSGCGTVENDSWVKFVAADPTAVIDYSINNCTNNWGVQLSVFSGSCGSMSLISGSCKNYAANNSTGTWTFTGLTPGDTYYIRADGYAGDLCTYSYNIVSGIALPVELIDFIGTSNASYNTLAWTTNTEINNSFFTLEKSIDGINFEFVAQLNGAGNSTSRIDYTYRDPIQNSGTIYYRLSQTNIDGKTTNLKVVSLETSDGFKCYPNPVNTELNISLKNSTNEIMTIQLKNCLGQTVIEEQTTFQHNNSIKINVAALNKGIYFIQVIDENLKVINSQKVIIE